MEKKKMHAIIDTLAFICFVFITATGLLMHYILPPGSGHFMELLGMDRHEWGQVHFWVSVAFLAILALHLVLHWKWIYYMIKGKPTETPAYRMALSILALIALLTLAVSPFLIPVEKSDQDKPHKNRMETMVTPAQDSVSEAVASDHAAETPKESAEAPEQKHAGGEFLSIKGSMSLSEFTMATGISYQALLEELGLPASTSPDERLGRLGKQHGFTMDDVRSAAERLQH